MQHDHNPFFFLSVLTINAPRPNLVHLLLDLGQFPGGVSVAHGEAGDSY